MSYTVLVLLGVIWNVNMHDSGDNKYCVYMREMLLSRIQRYLPEGDLWFFCLYRQPISGLSTIYRLWPFQGYSMSLYTFPSLHTFISLQNRRKNRKKVIRGFRIFDYLLMLSFISTVKKIAPIMLIPPTPR